MLIKQERGKANASAVSNKPFQILEAKNAGIVAVGKVKIEGIATYDRDVVKREIVRDALVSQYLFARPFIDACRAGARAA